MRQKEPPDLILVYLVEASIYAFKQIPSFGWDFMHVLQCEAILCNNVVNFDLVKT